MSASSLLREGRPCADVSPSSRTLRLPFFTSLQYTLTERSPRCRQCLDCARNVPPRAFRLLIPLCSTVGIRTIEPTGGRWIFGVPAHAEYEPKAAHRQRGTEMTTPSRTISPLQRYFCFSLHVDNATDASITHCELRKQNQASFHSSLQQPMRILFGGNVVVFISVSRSLMQYTAYTLSMHKDWPRALCISAFAEVLCLGFLHTSCSTCRKPMTTTSCVLKQYY